MTIDFQGMEILSKMINTQALLCLYMVFGVIMYRIGILKSPYRKAFMSLVINITLPMMILSSFNRIFTPDEIKTGALMLLLALIALIIAAGVAYIFWRRQPPEKRSVLVFGTLFSNAGNAGLPVASLVYGELGIFYASIFLVPVRLAMFTLGIGLYTKSKAKFSLLKLLKTPAVFIVFVGIFFMAFGITLPDVIGTGIKSIGDMTTPLSMMLIGSSLAMMRPRDLLDPRAFMLSFVRLILLPVLALLILKLLNIDILPLAVTVTLIAMPVAANTAIFAEQYGADHHFASRCVFISTLLSLFTVPLITWLITLI